jgi:hypothetical protein
MTGLPHFFTLTSENPYNRHRYKIFCVDGSVKVVDDYMQVIEAWWNYHQYCDHVEVIDAKTKGGGFA